MASSGLSKNGKTIGASGEHTKEVPNNASATSAQAQILLQALQDYVFPLISIPRGQKKKDTSQTFCGPEARKFLTALQEFVVSIIRSESNSTNQNGIEVDLNGGESKDLLDAGTGINDIILSPTNIPLPSMEFSDEPRRLEDGKGENAASGQRERIFAALRERVFNTFPIRLLHIEPLGSKLQIRLLEREGVYTHLAARLEARLEADYTESKFHLEVEKLCARQGLSWEEAEDNAIKEWISPYAKYSILSHTWARAAGGEVTYDDWQKNAFNPQQPGYQKLINFCETTWTNHKLTLGWMDTVCINKQSSSELDESIRSMYKWYQKATICITYLAGTRVLADMRHDPWFTRGWTFQELLAPPHTKFYNTDWKKLVKSHEFDNRDSNILQQIYKATTIDAFELRYGPEKMPISRKMQLAAKREVTREEDIAYSLMGLCEVSMSIAYGEGAKKAFFRLMSEILSSSPDDVLDVFNCAQKESSLIPSTPLPYIKRSNKFDGLVAAPVRQKPIEPLLLTHLGLRIPILLMPSLPAGHPNFKNNPIGDYYAAANVPVPRAKTTYTGPYHLLDKGLSISSTEDDLAWTVNARTDYTIIGVLNFGGDKTNIQVPTTCLATGFWSRWNVEWEAPSTSIIRIETIEPIVFQLMKRYVPGETKHHFGHLINRTELGKHGMKIVTMYL